MHEGDGSCRVCECVCVCACVRMSVPTLAAQRAFTKGFSLDCDTWILEGKKLSVRGMKKPICNELELTASRFRVVSGPTKHGSYIDEATGGSNVHIARHRKMLWV